MRRENSMRTRKLSLALLAAVPISGLGDARANGLTTHCWISIEARRALPAGPLKELLDEPTLYDALLSGTLFPDGGYAVGDGYGETAHWEPFHTAYAEWLSETHPPPWDIAEDGPYVAFLFGMLSHGMADESFDAMFMERSRLLDPGWAANETDLDTASDVLLAAAVGGITLPTLFLPADTLSQIFRDRLAYEVSPETLVNGTELARVALEYVDWARDVPERLSFFGEQYPWTRDHIADTQIAGAPPDEARIVAAYWERWWDRLRGIEHRDAPVFATRPRPMDLGSGAGYGHPREAGTPEARLWLGFSPGLTSGAADRIEVVDMGGEPVATAAWLFYGDTAHGVLVSAEDGWAADSTYTVHVPEGLPSWEGGTSSAPWLFQFSTGDRPWQDPAPADGDPGCGSVAWILPFIPLRRRKSGAAAR